MSENQNPQTPTSQPAETVTPEPAKPNLQIIDKGTFILEQVKFRPGTTLAGLEYFVKQYKSSTEEEAAESLKHMVTVWKPSQLVGLINTAVRSAQRVKAQAEITSEQDVVKQKAIYQRRVLQDPVLLKPEEAEAWIPGDRELTVQGMMRQVAKLMSEGKLVEANELLQKVNIKMAEELRNAEEIPATEEN